MKKSILSKAALIVGIAMLATISCKKDNNDSSQTATEQAAIDLSTSATASENMYDDAFDVVTQSSEQNNISVNSTGGTVAVNSLNSSALQTNSFTTTAGATITVIPADPAVFPKTMTIDYGAGVTSVNGITRKGQIVVTLSGKLRVAGSVISITYNNYMVNSYSITGTYALTPHIAAGGGVNYNITVTNGSITFPLGKVSTYSGTETFTQTGGIGTGTVTDDTYSITGNFNYSNTSAGSISGTVTTPLIKTADCKNITSGIIAFTYKSLNGTLDFGAGDCDNQATVKMGLSTKVVILPR